MRALLVFVCGLLIVASTATSMGTAEIHDTDATDHGADAPQPSAAFLAGVPATAFPAERDDGKDQVKAFAAAYPSVIGDARLVDGQWAVVIGEEEFAYAGGRFLPGALLNSSSDYEPLRFYSYDLAPLSRIPVVPEDRVSEVRDYARAVMNDAETGRRSNDFLDTLYGIDSLSSAENRMVVVQFLGTWIRVHPLLAEPLARVQRRIHAAMGEDRSVTAFVAGLESVHAYNWRNIAGTERRSYHSYGAAVDLMPRDYDGRWAYWLWAADSGVDEWWEIPIGDRYMVPGAVVQAFEAEGFVWGGKWLFFDNVHFEYRPEAILLASGG